MRQQPKTWLAISLICFALGAYFWRVGNERAALRRSAPATPAAASTTNAATAPRSLTAPTPLLALPAPRIQYAATNSFSEPPKSRYPYRLRNSSKTLDELVRTESALLLANALVDASLPISLPIPGSLRLQGETDSYVVQAKGVIQDTVRRLLAAEGAQIVSYVPNNALLVRLPSVSAARLRQSTLIQAVIPWEPYFKLEPNLLAKVIENKPVTEDLWLNVVAFPGEEDQSRREFQRLGVEVVSESASPFGLQFTLRPASASIASLAQVDTLQYLETQYRRGLMNDLTRVSLGIATNAAADTQPYLGLSGTNVIVNVNDTGVDRGHPDLLDVFGDPSSFLDLDGHGTHVAGIIASTGKSSPGSTNAPGSSTNSIFRGKAPGARIFVLPLDLAVGPTTSDSYMQETAARTNALISNNSWGYVGAYGYTLNSASFDAAVRDALPRTPGDQPILYVFAAANDGSGDSGGEGGFADTISSPGNAKNVITVGALESLRRITNAVVTSNAVTMQLETNSFFLVDTDSNDQVADYSSRGNVGRTVEGEAGRFKPDVVAPGSYVVSTRSSSWNDPTTLLSYVPLGRDNQLAQPLSTNRYSLFLSDDAIRVVGRTVPNFRSPDPFPNLLMAARKGFVAPPPADASGVNFVDVNPASGGDYVIAVGNTNTFAVPYDIRLTVVITNSGVENSYFQALKDINDQLKPTYRYESGTSMAAPAISGMMALIYEFLRDRLGMTNPSPALMKAMLINGTQPVALRYDREVNSRINYQGWGKPVLTNIIPAQLNDNRAVTANPSSPMWFTDQDATTALATGQSLTRTMTVLDSAAQLQPLKISLVWTDPPGNPAVSTKLVNDLDLVVTNLDNQDYYVGNNIPSGSDVVPRSDTNSPPLADVVNNVENVFISGPLGKRYSVTVKAKRVNVNAVTGHPNGIVQDFALVIASGRSTLSNVFQIDPVTSATENLVYYKEITNSIPLLKEHVGANMPRPTVPSPNGELSQWNFYKFVNVGNTNPYVAIVTFQPPNLSRTRLREADIDLYVSQSSDLTNLNPGVVLAADKSRKRGGTEYLTYNNSPADSVYYIAVKAEDQQSSEFGLIAIATNEPFDSQDASGRRHIRLLPIPAAIPDGSPENTVPLDLFGFGLLSSLSGSPSTIQNVMVTNVFEVGNQGDIATFLSQSGIPGVEVTLSPHTIFDFAETRRIVYDDVGDPTRGVDLASRPSEGPGRLISFIGQQADGLWQMKLFDNAPFHTGRVTVASITVVPSDTNCLGADGCLFTIPAMSWSPPLPFEIESDVVQADFCVTRVSGDGGPLDLYVGLPGFPTPNDFYAYEQIDQSPTECLTLSYFSSPVIKIGRGIVRIYNPNPGSVDIRYRASFLRGLQTSGLSTFVWTNGPVSISDAARMSTTITVPTNQTIIDLKVGVRLDHPNVADLTLSLVSPQGTRWLLMENRGGASANALGFTLGSEAVPRTPLNLLSNYSWVTFTDNSNTAPNLIKFSPPPFRSAAIVAQPIVYEGNFDLDAVQTYPAGANFNGWRVESNRVGVIVDDRYASSRARVLALSDGRVSRVLPVLRGREYQLKFAYRKTSSSQVQQVTTNIATFFYPGYLLSDHDTGTIAPALSIDKVRICPGQYVEITAPANDISIVTAPATSSTPEGLTGGGPYRGLTRYALVGQWSYSSAQLTPFTAASAPFFVGTNSVVQAPTDPGDYYLWLAINDENNGNNDNSVEAGYDTTIRWQQCQVDSFQYVLGGATNTIYPTDYWQTNTISFLAGSQSQDLAFQALWNSTTLIDSVVLLEPIATAYYGSEEALESSVALQYNSGSGEFVELPAVRGENAAGDWRLEILDTRANPGAANHGTLYSWYLQILFAPTQQPIPLTNLVTYSDQIRPNQVKYFVVNVPREAISARNTLSGTNLFFFYNRDSLPQGFFRDPFTPPGNSFTIDISQPAGVELQPGGRYYLAVTTIDPSIRTNLFDLRVEMELPLANLLAAPGSTISSNLAGAFTNILTPGTNMHWYEYTVIPSPTLTAVTFDLETSVADRSVHLVARRGLPVVDYLPTPTRYDYHSINHNTNSSLRRDEVIIIRSNAFPVPMTATSWLLGVYNTSTNPVSYDLRATRFTAPPPLGSPLPGYSIDTTWNSTTNAVAFSIPPGTRFNYLNYFYRFLSSVTNSALLFEIYGLDGDADLIVRRNDLPSPSLYDFSDLQYGTRSEHVVLITNLFLPSFGPPTNWFINVVNSGFTTVNGTLRVATATLTNTIVSAAPLELDPVGVDSNGGIVIVWRSLAGMTYEIQGAPSVSGPFATLAIVSAISSTTQWTDPSPPLPPTPRYYRVIQLP